MKKIFKRKNKTIIISSFALIAIALVITGYSNPLKDNVVSFNKGYEAGGTFSDDNFYKCVINSYNEENDTSYDVSTVLTDEQLASITRLNCSGYGEEESGKITYVNDLDKFVSLSKFDISYNKLTSLDAGDLSELSELNMEENPFAESLYVYKGKTVLAGNNIDLPRSINWYNPTWTSEDTTMATVNNYGLVTALNAGVVNINSQYTLENEGVISNNSSINIVSITSDEYLINEENDFIYVGVENNESIIESNIAAPDGVTVDVNLSNNKVMVKAGLKLLKTFDVVRVSSSSYDLTNSYIYTGGIEIDEELVDAVNAEVFFEGDKLQVVAFDEVLEEFDVVSVISYDYTLGDSYIYTGSVAFDVDLMQVDNASLHVVSDKVQVKRSNEILGEFDIVSIDSSSYEFGYDYVFSNSATFDINQITVLNGNKSIVDDKLLITYDGNTIDELSLIYLKFGSYSTVNNAVLIDNVSYEDFTGSIVKSTAVSFKIFNGETEVVSGALQPGMVIDVYYDEEVIKTYKLVSSSASSYTVSVNVVNGSSNKASIVTYGDAEFMLTPVKGYGDEEVVCTNGQIGSVDDDILSLTGVTSDTSCTVTFNPVEYEILYDLDGGTVSDPNVDLYTILDTVTLNNPTREGYEFAGWSTIDDDTLVMNVVIPEGTTGDKQYIANWSPNKYKITLNNNDDQVDIYERYGVGLYSNIDETLEINSVTKPNDLTHTATFNYNGANSGASNLTLTSGLKFQGYFTMENGMGEKLIDKNGNFTEEFTSDYFKEDSNLYAYYTEESIVLPDPTKYLYNFDGWYSDADLTTKFGNANASIILEEDVELYAKWSNAKPLIPSNFKATAIDYRTIKLTWTDNPSVSAYKIYKYNSAKKAYYYLTTVSDNSLLTTSGTKTGYYSYYKIKACTDTLCSDLSKNVSAKPFLKKPTTFKVVKYKAGVAKISYSKVSGASGYAIYRYNSAKKGYYLWVNTTKTSVINTGRKKGSYQYYKVRAYRIVDGKKVYGELTLSRSARV